MTVCNAFLKPKLVHVHDMYCLPVVSGVPQLGISVGPTSFHINDVATCTSSGSNVNMFADDIALYHIIKTFTDYAHLLDATSECIRRKIYSLTLPSAKRC